MTRRDDDASARPPRTRRSPSGATGPAGSSGGVEAPRRRVLVWRWTVLAGAETFIRNQVDAYSSWQAHLIGADRVLSPNAADGDRALFAGGRGERLLRQLFRVADWSPRLGRALREIDPQLIHAHFAIDGMRMRRAARRRRIPLVVTLHGSDVTAQPGKPGLRGVRYRHRLRSLFRDAALLVAVSEHIASAARRWGAPAAKLVVLPVGVPGRPAPGEGPRADVLFVGRLVEKKGVADLITAFAGLDPRLRGEHRLLVVGDGPLRGELEAQAEASGAVVEFLGFADPETVQRRLGDAAALAVPSRTAGNGDTEGLPTVVFEAARASTPVVGYAHAGIPEAVEDGVTGLLAEEGDVAGLRSRLATLLGEPGRARALGRAARERFEEDFDIARQTAQLEELYERVLRGEPGPLSGAADR